MIRLGQLGSSSLSFRPQQRCFVVTIGCCSKTNDGSKVGILDKRCKGRVLSTTKRSYPQYSLFGENCRLLVKPIFPTFKDAGTDAIALARPGRIMFEFFPRATLASKQRGSFPSFSYDDGIGIALTVEEIGSLVSKLPSESFTQHRNLEDKSDDNNNSGFKPYTSDAEISTTEKVFTVTPDENGDVKFMIDYQKDGVGGQDGPSGVGGDSGVNNVPMEIKVQAGEFEVIKNLMTSSIPYLLGWNGMMNIAFQTAVEERVGFRTNKGKRTGSGGTITSGDSVF